MSDRSGIMDFVICPVCKADPELQPDCSECYGRGSVDSVPLPADPWNHITGTLWIGGHDCADPAMSTVVTNEFDMVVSLHSRYGYGPGLWVTHHTHRMPDGYLSAEDAEEVIRLADKVVEALEQQRKVLVRCQAGLNRSSLIAATALVRQGADPDSVIRLIREKRSPYALFNAHFEKFVRENAAGA